MTSPRALPYHRPDRDPEGTEYRILQLLDAVAPWGTIQRRKLSREVHGTDLVGASATEAALGRLKSRRLVVEVRAHVYRITPAGSAALALRDELDRENEGEVG